MELLISNVKNFVYLFLWFFIGFLYFAFYLISVIFSVGVSFTVVGIPILAGVFRTIPFLLDLDRKAAEKYAHIKIPSLKWESQDKVTKEVSDKRNWFAVGIMVFPRFLLGFLTFIVAFVCYLLPIAMILSPYMYRLFDMTIIMIVIDTLPRAIVACIAGIILLLLLPRLAEKIVKWAGSYTENILETIRSWR
ncbi:sensor domain-containing protein [Lederbergia sp. NSJ-179]|uniref:sensor domain-containing protein n=1 Tax=Lederbergia sp. NSJ-179 TaxID=2931402 RepID=UPI001FD1C660|nr:sensor domain-containing protein [Lederbergia sp. NSJ-179]MCJ7843170.1 sensor domain-containing protein [Lederbergia sp. NSJ-179]